MNNYAEEWQRLNVVIVRSGMSINRFSMHIGLSHAENLYRIKRGQNGISRQLADRIVSHYPEISKGWLLTGEGQMLKPATDY